MEPNSDSAAFSIKGWQMFQDMVVRSSEVWLTALMIQSWQDMQIKDKPTSSYIPSDRTSPTRRPQHACTEAAAKAAEHPQYPWLACYLADESSLDPPTCILQSSLQEAL